MRDTGEKRVTALDGVRGIAALSVFFFHALGRGPYEPFVRLGFLGVQVFFVLSGFLITERLFALVDRSDLTPRRRWASFAVRRAARIVPLYYATLALIAVDHQRLLRESSAAWPWLLTYTTNFASFFGGEQVGPLHFWSLCVEEQYYLAFPLLVLTPLRRWLGAITLGSIIGSVVLRTVCPEAQAYQLPVMHFDSFGAGVMGALVFRDGHVLGLSPRAFHVVGGAGWLAFVEWLVGPWTPLGHTGLCLGAASLVLALRSGKFRPGSVVLGSWPLVALGRISYGFYLLHPFVLRYLLPPLRQEPVLRAAVALVLSVVVAALSFRFFEKPILAWAHHRTPMRAEPKPVSRGASPRAAPLRP